MEKTEKKKISFSGIVSLVVKVVLGAFVALLVFVAANLAYDKYVKKSAIPTYSCGVRSFCRICCCCTWLPAASL